VLIEHKQKLLDMADALLARETLDAEQVKRLASGLPIDEPLPAAAAGAAPMPPREPKVAKEKDRQPMVPPIPPRPVTQE
jgi:hypothetical protein